MRLLHIFLLFFAKNIKSTNCTKFGEFCSECNDEKCTLCADNFRINKDPTSINYNKCEQCKSDHCQNYSSNYEICEYCDDYYGLDKRETSDTYNLCISCQNFHCLKCPKDFQKCEQCDSYSGNNLEESTPDNIICNRCYSFYCQNCSSNYESCDKCNDGMGLDHNPKPGVVSICKICLSPGCASCYEDYTKCEVCSNRYYLNPTTKSCEKYNSELCWDCSENKYNCTECQSHSGLVKNSNENYDLYSCEQCPENCLKCFNSICIECDIGYGLNEIGNCVNCTNNLCYNCSTNSTFCNECNTGYFVDLDENSFTYTQCVRCSKNCENCLNESICISCADNYGVDEYGKCVKCNDPQCINCNKNYTYCTKCEKGYGVHLGYDKCVECDRCSYCINEYADKCSLCPDGYGGLIECQKCSDPNCIHCPNDLNQCTKCKANYWLENNKCIIPSDFCKEYTNKHSCKKCYEGYILASDPFYIYKCVKNDSIPHCIQYYISDKLYCTKCEYGYGIIDDIKCVECDDPHCIICDKNTSECTFCKGDYYLSRIHNSCSLCEADYCEFCYIYNDKCDTCYDGFYSNGYICYPCPENCKRCFKNICYECKPGYSLYESQCIENINNCLKYSSNYLCEKCDDGYYIENGQCLKCKDENCALCDSKICLECMKGYDLDRIKGSSNYLKCYKCEVNNCEKCHYDSKVCDKCFDNLELINNECIGDIYIKTIPPTKSPSSSPSMTPSKSPLPARTRYQYNGTGNELETNKKITKNDIYGIIISGIFIIGIIIFIILYFIFKKKYEKDFSSNE